MPRINEIQFAQTSPSSFFYRSSKRPYTLNNDYHQISDSDILQKLKLILISMREQSFKANKYFQQEMQKIQSQKKQQSNIITLLQEQNKLLRSHINIYESKFGGLAKICRKNQQNLSNEVNIFNQSGSVQNKQIIEDKNDQNSFLNIENDKKENNLSKMSTKYESNIQVSQIQQQKHKKQEHHQETSSKYTDELLSQNGSTCSNFYKKSLPYHHRRQSSLQQQQSKGLYENHDINILPLITRCQKAQKTEFSKISQLQSRKNTIIDIFNEEDSSQQQSQEVSSEINQLGLESKGNGFFSSGQKWASQNAQETLLIQNYEPRYENQNAIKLCRYVESREDFADYQEEQEKLKEECGMKKMSSIIQRNDDNIQSWQKIQQAVDESEEKGIQNLSSQNIEHKSSICGQKRLRALFAPLKQNIMSKKINLPFMNKEEHNNQLPRQIEKSSQILDVLADFNKKKSYGFENGNPFQQAIKKLKKTEEMKVKY